MAMSAVIDVVLGLIFMYLLLSLICTVVNEFLASVAKLRAKNLSKGIDKIVDDRNLQTALRSVGIFKMAGAPPVPKVPRISQQRPSHWRSSMPWIRKAAPPSTERWRT